jgi:hypothetical protein
MLTSVATMDRQAFTDPNVLAFYVAEKYYYPVSG